MPEVAEPATLGGERRATQLFVSDTVLPDTVGSKEFAKKRGTTGKICGAGGHLS